MKLVPSSEALRAGEGRIGGKSMGLARLSSVAAPVPPWFAVPTEFFLEHVAEASLRGVLLQSLSRMEGLDPTEASGLKAIQTETALIQSAIISAELSSDLVGALEASLPSISPGPFAVRSSMVGEDSDAFSFAGQLDSFLFQRTIPEIADSVKRCWASAFGDRSVAYHLRSGLPIFDIRVGVVVQRMIDGDVSGVMFTADPISGHREQSLITAAWGQGEGIVSGLCNTDAFVWGHQGEEISVTLADKDIKVVRADTGVGTVEREVEGDARDERCLSAGEVTRIGEEGARVAKEFGKPQDIEWTIEKGELFFVQSRPITSLPAPPNTDGPRVVWDNSNIQESYCGVTTPLTFSYAVRAYETAYRQTAEALQVSRADLDAFRPRLKNLLGLIRGRVYYNINNWYRGLLLLPSFGTNKSDMEKMMGLEDSVDFVEDTVLSFGEKLSKLPRMLKTLAVLLGEFRRLPKTVPAFLGNFEKTYQLVNREALASMTFSELMELNEHLRVNVQENWHTPIINDFYVMMTNGNLRRFVIRTGLENPISVQNNLLAGEDGIESTEPTRFLLTLARDGRKDETFSRLVLEGDPLESLQRIREEYPAFAERIDDYIERYGDRVMGELKLETITLRENPSFVIEILRNYIVRPDLDPDELRAKEKSLRADAEALVKSRLGLVGRIRFRSAVGKAREAVKNRENMRLTRTRAFGLSRDIYRALGERLFEAGVLPDGRDIFYLTVDEIEAYFDGRSVGTTLSGLSALRREEFDGFESQDVPHHFETVGPVYFGNQYKYEGAIEVDLNANSLKGTGCYPGVVESPIRLIFSPEDELSLNGKILCTVRTDPGWAPLFPTASGILVERGSTLSHSAVVARELGIPAIVGVPGLTSILSDGEAIRMNGETGVVDRLDMEDGGTDGSEGAQGSEEG